MASKDIFTSISDVVSGTEQKMTEQLYKSSTDISTRTKEGPSTQDSWHLPYP